MKLIYDLNFFKLAGGLGSGVTHHNTEDIKGYEKSPLCSLHTRKDVLRQKPDQKNVSIPLSKIKYVSQDKYVIKKLANALKADSDWTQLPIDVLFDGKYYHIVDGHHRFLAMVRLGEKYIKANVRNMFNKEAGKDRNLLLKHKDASKAWVYIKPSFNSGGPDITEHIVRRPSKSYAIGVRKARRLSNTALLDTIKSMTPEELLEPRGMGFTAEYRSRGRSLLKNKQTGFVENPESIGGVNKKIPSYDKKHAKEVEGPVANRTLLAIGGNMLMGFGVRGAMGAFGGSKDDISSFAEKVKKYKGLSTKINVTDGLDAYYIPSQNSINTGGSLFTAAHELGHATMHQNMKNRFGDNLGSRLYDLPTMDVSEAAGNVGSMVNKDIGYTIGSELVNRFGGPIANIPLVPIMALSPLLSRRATKALGGDKKNTLRHKFFSKVYQRPDLVMAAAVAPKLIDEGLASYHALKSLYKFSPEGSKLKEVGRGLLQGLPAWATYATAAGIPVAVGYGLRRSRKLNKGIVQENMDKIKPKLKNKVINESEKKAFISPLEALGIGGAALVGTRYGRDSAESSASNIAPYGQKERARKAARALGIMTALGGSVAGMHYGKKYGPEIMRTISKNIDLDPEATELVRNFVAPAVTMAGGVGAGYLTGAAVGGYKRLRHGNGKKNDKYAFRISNNINMKKQASYGYLLGATIGRSITKEAFIGAPLQQAAKPLGEATKRLRQVGNFGRLASHYKRVADAQLVAPNMNRNLFRHATKRLNQIRTKFGPVASARLHKARIAEDLAR